MAYDTHDICPYVYPPPSDPRTAWLATYMARAWTTAQDWALHGDSRTSSPQGRGIVFTASMNARSASMFGGLSLLPIQSQFSSGGGSPPAGFPARMATNGQGTVTFNTSSTGNRLPCGFQYYKATNAGSGGGSQTLFIPDNHLGSKSSRFNGGGAKFYGNTRSIYAEVWICNDNGTGVAAVSDSEDIIVEVKEQAGDTSSWAGTSISSTTQASLGLNTGSFACRKFRFGPFSPISTSRPYHSLNVRGNAVATSTYGVVAQRLVYGTAAQQIGMAFTPMGYGGAKVSDIWGDTANGGSASDIAGYGNMKNCGPVLAALDFKGVVHVCGQNDAGSSVTKATIKAAMLAAIDNWRAAVGWNIPYIILNNPFNPGLSSSNSSLESTYAQAWVEICDLRPNVYFFNIRRATEDFFGWTSTAHPAQTGGNGEMPAGLSYKGNWTVGASYVVDDVVTINGVQGVALTVSGGAGTFTAGETVTQATSGATGIFISLSGTQLYLSVTSGTFNGSNALTGGSSGATRNVSAVRFDSLYARTGTNMPNDYNPRGWWRCISNHTAAWGSKPGTESSSTDGFGEWNQIYPYCDPADPAHWNTEGASVVADAFFLLQSQLVQQAVGLNAIARRPRGR